VKDTSPSFCASFYFILMTVSASRLPHYAVTSPFRCLSADINVFAFPVGVAASG
jgi:hypothetical protein